MSLRKAIVVSALWLLSLARGVVAQVGSVPVAIQELRQNPLNVVGLMYSSGVGGMRAGSGAVIRHPKVILSCAHLVYSDLENSPIFPWRTENYWFHDWNSSLPPALSDGRLLRGYYFFSSYASFAERYHINGQQTFANDFVAHFSYEDLARGGFGGYWPEGKGALLSNQAKTIAGYPSGLYGGGDPRRYLLHRTGPFANPMVQQLDNYLTLVDVSAGPGNSGGPVFVSDGTSDYFAGVYIAGLEKSRGDSADVIGVYGMTSASWELVEKAIADADRADPLWQFSVGATPKIGVAGREEQIRNNDRSPRIMDDTDFGSVLAGSQEVTRQFSITNMGTAVLQITKPVRAMPLQRGARAYFRVVKQPAGEILPGATSILRVRFSSSRFGDFYSQINIESNDAGAQPFSFVVRAKRSK